MVSTLRLAVRVVRGGGRIALVRMALTVVGVLLGIQCLLVVHAIPSILHARTDRAAARLPTFAHDPNSVPIHFAIIEDTHHGRLWTRVLVAGDSGAPAPPGLTSLPAAGTTIASPALASAANDPVVAARLPNVRGVIANSGLEGPGEYISYTGVRVSDLPAGGEPGAGFGGASSLVPDRPSTGAVTLELLLMILVPACIFLTVVARLSSATRRRRLAALRLIGASRREVRTIAAIESAVPGVLGALLAVLTFPLTNLALAHSNAVGSQYFPHDGALSAGLAISVVAAAGLVSAAVGSGVSWRARGTVSSRAGERSRRPGWLAVLPFLAGVAMLASLQLVVGTSNRVEPAKVTVAAIALALLGLLLAMRPITLWCANLLSHTVRSLPVRLGLARFQYEPDGALRTVNGLLALVMIAALGQAVLFDFRESSGVDQAKVQLGISGSTLQNPAQRAAAAQLPAEVSVATVQSLIARQPAGVAGTPSFYAQSSGAFAVYASCAQVAKVSGRALPDCREGESYRLYDPTAAGPEQLGGGLDLPFENADGSTRKLRTPSTVLPIPGLFNSSVLPDESVLITGTKMPAGGWPKSSTFNFVLDAHDLEPFEDGLAGISPTAVVTVMSSDESVLETYRLNRGSVDLGLAIGFLLAMLTFVISAIDRSWEGRRAVATVSVLGMPRRSLQIAQAVQLGLPLMLGLLMSVFISDIAARRYLSTVGYSFGTHDVSLRWSLALAGIAVLAAGLPALVTFGRSVNPSLIKRD